MKKEWQKNGLLTIGLGVVFLMYKFLDKSSLIVFIKTVLTGDVAGLLAGIILGEKGAMSKHWYQIFIETGVIHVVVASGSNLAILSYLIIDSLAWVIGRKRAIVLGLSVVCFYINLVGFVAPIARASIILFIYYWAQILGKKFNMVSSLVLMLFAMVLVDLDMVKTVSFWMSLVAFTAVVNWKEIYRGKNKLLGLMGLNVWVNLWLWPMTSLVFGRINWLGLVVGPLVLFGVEYVYVMGLIAMLMLFVSKFVAGGILMLTVPFLKYFLLVCKFMAGLNFGSIEFRFNWFMVVGWYMVLLSLLLKKNRNYN